MDYCLLRETPNGYHLHDLVLEYLRLVNKIDTETRARVIRRQAQYLSNPGVLHAYATGDTTVGGDLHSLVRMWNALTTLDREMDVKRHYLKTLANLDGSDGHAWSEAGYLLQLLVRIG